MLLYLPCNLFTKALICLILHGDTVRTRKLDARLELNSDPGQKYNRWFSCLYVAAYKPRLQRGKNNKNKQPKTATAHSNKPQRIMLVYDISNLVIEILTIAPWEGKPKASVKNHLKWVKSKIHMQ